MSNEVTKDFDELFLEFIERHKLQIWPERYPDRWVVQCPKPFSQVARENLKAALTHMAFKLGDLRFTNDNPGDH